MKINDILDHRLIAYNQIIYGLKLIKFEATSSVAMTENSFIVVN